MKDTHVLIPLDLYAKLQEEYNSIKGNEIKALMQKSYLNGKMAMFYDDSFIRLHLSKDSIEQLKNSEGNQMLTIRQELKSLTEKTNS